LNFGILFNLIFRHYRPLVLNNHNNRHFRIPIHPLLIHFRSCVLVTFRHHQNLFITMHIHRMNINYCDRIFCIIQIYIYIYVLFYR
jgi:hypothetical protein